MIRCVELELPFPPPRSEELVQVMRTAIEEAVPPGERLHKLISNDNIGPDLGSDFRPCWRMSVVFETQTIEPLTWGGTD